MKNTIKTLCIAIGMVGILLSSCQNEATSDAGYSALIVTGQNNHNWEASTPILKEILEGSGLFTASVAQSPAKGEDMASFLPVFSDYDLVVLDYNGDHWPKETQDAFIAYVKEGGAVVVYHAADNAFPEWKEFNKIIGLGGWGNRTEANGPYVRWEDGEFTRDLSPGRGGSHGKQHAFVIKHRNTEHPITKGLPDSWLHAQDELYSELRGPAENMTVLATAYADTAQNGTGKHEPMLMTIKYGKGRVFHTVLGHVGRGANNPAAECVGFIVTFLRGAEWAVRGDVTQEIPDAFPGVNTVSRWNKFRAYTMEELMDCMTNYEQGVSRSCFADLQTIIRNASNDPDELLAIEKRFITFLQSNANADAKNLIMQELSLFGTAASTSALEDLMKKDDTKEMARFAIERINDTYTNN